MSGLCCLPIDPQLIWQVRGTNQPNRTDSARLAPRDSRDIRRLITCLLYLAIVLYKMEGRKLLWKNVLSCTMTSVVHGIGACLVGNKPQNLTISVCVAITLYHLSLYLLILYLGWLRIGNSSCGTSVLVLPIVAGETDRAGSEEGTL